VAKVPVSKLVPGMILSKPVINSNGMVMLGEDTELTRALIERIDDMGVGGVHIKGYSQPHEPKDELLRLLDERFSKVEKEPHMDRVKRLLREHIEGLYE
jgi:hypothetical protein